MGVGVPQEFACGPAQTSVAPTRTRATPAPNTVATGLIFSAQFVV